MQEEVVLEIALPRVLAVDDAVDVLEQGVARDRAASLHMVLLHDLADVGLAVLGIGVRRLPFRHPSPLAPRNGGQHLEDAEERVGVVARARHVADAELVGLCLVAPGVLEVHEPEAGREKVAVLPDVLGEDHPDAQADLLELLAAHLADGVPRGHVSDLVPEHAGELRLGLEVGQDAPRHVDEPARKGEGVDHRVVHHLERPGEIGALGGRREPVADARHVALERRVVHQTQGRPDLLVGCASHLDLLLLADQRELTLSRSGVHGAAEDEERSEGNDDSDEAHWVFSWSSG